MKDFTLQSCGLIFDPWIKESAADHFIKDVNAHD